MKEYRVGLLGMGGIGRVHTYAMNALPFLYDNLPFRAKLAGVYNRTHKTALSAVEQYGFEFAAKTMDELIERDDIDVIDICLPNHQHEQFAIKALQAGKHLYCEKPLCVSYEGALRIKAAADKSKAKVQMVYNNRFYPAILRAKQIMDEGRLGQLYSFEAAYSHSSNIDPKKPYSWRFSKEYTGGGTLADMGSHVIDLLVFLAGGFARVNASLHTAASKRQQDGLMKDVEVEDAAYVMAQMQNGAKGTILATKLATGTNDDLYIKIYGEKGAIRFNSDNPEFIEFYDNTQKAEPFGGNKGFKKIESHQKFGQPASDMPSPKMTMGWLRSHVHCMYSFFDCIYNDQNCSPCIDDGVYNQYILEKAYESAKAGKWIDL